MAAILILSLIVYAVLYRRELSEISKSSVLIAPALIPLIAAGVAAGAKAIKAGQQRRKARKLRESKFVPPELMMNKDLAELQAYSRTAPGTAKAEENIRRGQANALSRVMRTSGGDTGKIAAASVASQQAAQDAYDRLQTRGQEFSENAFGRLANANLGLAGQKIRNRDQFNQARNALVRASDQNYMNAFDTLMSGAMASASMYGGGGGAGGGGMTAGNLNPNGANYWMQNMNQSDPTYQYYMRNGFGTYG